MRIICRKYVFTDIFQTVYHTLSYYIDVACNIRQYVLLSNVQHSLTQIVTNKKHISLTQNLIMMKDYLKLVVSSCAAVKMKSWKGKHFRNQVRYFFQPDTPVFLTVRRRLAFLEVLWGSNQ